jgi:hypothetical protein
MNMAGFTAELALSMAGRGYLLSSAEFTEATGVRAARINTGGGLGFTCGGRDFPGQCSCDGPSDSADCKAMQKNCSGPISCGWFVDNCTCPFRSFGRFPVATFSTTNAGIRG